MMLFQGKTTGSTNGVISGQNDRLNERCYFRAKRQAQGKQGNERYIYEFLASSESSKERKWGQIYAPAQLTKKPDRFQIRIEGL